MPRRGSATFDEPGWIISRIQREVDRTHTGQPGGSAPHPRAWYTGCRPADHSPRPYDGRLLDENYRTALPHIAFRYEPLSNTGHGIFGAVVIAVDHACPPPLFFKLS